MTKNLWMLVALLAGSFLPIQAALNTKLGKAIESPVHASLISFVVGALAMVGYALVTQQPVAWAGLRTAPTYTWLAGFLGAFYVTAVILSFPRLGPALTFGLVIAGQMLISAGLEHFNVLVAEPHPLTFWRVLGIGLVITGVLIIRRF